MVQPLVDDEERIAMCTPNSEQQGAPFIEDHKKSWLEQVLANKRYVTDIK